MTLPRHAEIWLPGYARDRLRVRGRKPVKRVWLAFTDHFEPLWSRADEDTASRRVGRWATNWPRIAARIQPGARRGTLSSIRKKSIGHICFRPWSRWSVRESGT